MRRILLAAMAAIAPNLAAAADAATELAKLRQEIAGLIGPARCINLVQCRVAGLGFSPCGGPAEYITYSWLSTDKGELETRIAEYNFLHEDVQKAQQATGACVVLEEPVAACVNGHCVLPAAR
jgi:hypothetical protein